MDKTPAKPDSWLSIFADCVGMRKERLGMGLICGGQPAVFVIAQTRGRLASRPYGIVTL